MRKAIGKILFGLGIITGASWAPVSPSMLGPTSVSATEEVVWDCKLCWPKEGETGGIFCCGTGTLCHVA